MRETYYRLLEECRNHCKKLHKQRCVVGLSGGLDSAVTLQVCVDALGSKNVAAIIMPEKGLTAEENTADALHLAKKLKVKHLTIDISPFLDHFGKLAWKQSKYALMNTKARIRALMLFNYADSNNALVAGSSTKSELLLGYGISHGDMAADFYVLGALLKTEVIELAKHLQLPENIIRKKPSPELTVGQTAEADLGATYHKLDSILRKYLANERLNKKDYLVKKTLLRIEKNRHRQIPILEMPG